MFKLIRGWGKETIPNSIILDQALRGWSFTYSYCVVLGAGTTARQYRKHALAITLHSKLLQ